MESESLRQISHLPEEIMTDILSRLTAKSLVRFNFTSKSWLSLISSKHFIKAHSTKNPTFGDHRILSITKEPEYELHHLSLCSLLSDRVTYATHGDFPIDKSVRSLKMVGSCNGLVCILINRKDFFLWNPTTTESKKLPDAGGCGFGYVTERGFGFDESSGDYKVYGVFSSQYRAIGKIYSLKANSWTSINYNFKDGSTLLFRKGKFVSGNLHWCRTKSELNWRWYISSFDLKNEVHGIMEQPGILDDDFDPILGVFNGCLSMFYHNRVHGYLDNRFYDLWVLKRYGVRDSWRRLMSICVDPLRRFGLLTPFHVTSQNREVLFKSGRYLIIYNSKENHFQCWEMIDSNKFLKLVYVESLESLVSQFGVHVQTGK
ncbi:hypothetical protein CDL12_10609 [Handroanthus impetiginosus]|uniref:F-box domain-containing protein n=1 Tax=Handroanthus impetiginosus TaxID=429701 RepID=A0A2G9HGT2_9LAMI|nr:hypothetical protein CDL12_10609 [Handroanthus impetiginosus]